MNKYSLDEINSDEQLLEKIKNVDGMGSGLDADLVQGIDIVATKLDTAALLTEIKAVDGDGSGLDADLLDGIQCAELSMKTPNFDSGWFSVSSNTTYSLTNTSGVLPRKILCLFSPTSDGTEVSIVGMINSSYDNGYNVRVTSTDIYLITGYTNICVYHDGSGYAAAPSGYYKLMLWE